MFFSFLYPKFLFLLLLVPIFILAYIISFVYHNKRAIVFPNFEAMERIFGVEILSRNSLSLIINISIVVLLVLALSGMQISMNKQASAYSYVLAIDNSASMMTNDIEPTRLDAAKETGKSFVDMIPAGNEIGVLEFSGVARTILGLETSKIKIKMAIDTITAGDNAGSDILDAVSTASEILKMREMKSIILVTDGQITESSLGQIIDYAKRNSVVVNTISVGTVEGGLTEIGVVSKSDKDFLLKLAEQTGGKYFDANDFDELKKSFKDIFKLVETTVYLNIDIYLLISTIFLIFANWILFSFRFRTIP